MTEKRDANLGQPTELGQSTGEQAFVVAVFVLVGAGLGWLVELLAGWLVTLPWAPMQGPAELVTSIPQPWLTIGLISLGALVGLVAGVAVQQDELSASVSGSEITLTRKGESQRIPAVNVAMVFQDGKELVVLGHQGEELAREKSDIDSKRIAAACTEHGYTWAEQDPHQDEFRLWVPDIPGLPEGANALLKARDQALKKKDSGSEVRELRQELAKLGLVVRDDKGRQYWRTTRPA